MLAIASAIFVAFVAFLVIVKPSRILYIRLLSVPALCVVFIACLMLLSETAVKAALNGLKLWAVIVVPSLFPFFVAAEILNATGFTRAAGLLLDPLMKPFFNVPGCGSFALALGISSGYPVGAKITCDLRSKGCLTRVEAERLLAFTNNSGPLFIVGAVGTGMYGSPRLGLLLLACHISACLTVGFIFRFYKSGKRVPLKKINTSSREAVSFARNRRKKFFGAFLNAIRSESGAVSNIGTLIGDSIRNSVWTILSIGGFIVLFSVIINILDKAGIIGTIANMLSPLLLPAGTDIGLIKGIISGVFEITTGSNLISSAGGVPPMLRLPAASLVIGWAGFSVHFQVLSIASRADVGIRPYLLGKLLQGLISAIYTWFCLKCFGLNIIAEEPVLGSFASPAVWFSNLGSALLILTVVLIILTLSAICAGYLPYTGQTRKHR